MKPKANQPMSIPPSLRKIAPSLKVGDGETATLSLVDVKSIFPSFEIDIQGQSVPSDGTIKISIADLRKILRLVLSSVAVDEGWYLGQVSGLRQDIQKGKFDSPAEHYMMHGYLEGRLPERPVVDEQFYLQQYPDIGAAVKSGTLKSGFDHFVKDGYAEGRMPVPPPTSAGRKRAGAKK
jgi:hypothetical protein